MNELKTILTTPRPKMKNACDEAIEVYLKSDVDAAIAELKQKLEDAKATAYTDSVDAGMRERRLKRALWLARAECAKWKSSYYWYAVSMKHDSRMYDEVEHKCRAKAEEYK